MPSLRPSRTLSSQSPCGVQATLARNGLAKRRRGVHPTSSIPAFIHLSKPPGTFTSLDEINQQCSHTRLLTPRTSPTLAREGIPAPHVVHYLTLSLSYRLSNGLKLDPAPKTARESSSSAQGIWNHTWGYGGLATRSSSSKGAPRAAPR
jgi:hypothetical protein